MRKTFKSCQILFLTALTAINLSAEKTPKPSEKVSIDLYVMSLCPFGVQAENIIIPAVKSLEDKVDLNIHFIANEIPATENGGKTGGFKALHGQPEVDENIRQLCVERHFPKVFLDYILERNKNYRDPNWQEAALKTGIDSKTIDACAAGEEGAALLRENIKKHMERGTASSPTIDIGGKPYAGARGRRAITLAACQELREKGTALPNGCADAEAMPPDPVPGGAADDGCGDVKTGPVFNIRIVVDGSCQACEPTLIGILQRQHPNAVIRTIDVSAPEGQKLVKRQKARSLPLYVLDKKVRTDPNFQILSKTVYVKSADGYVIKPGSHTYNPTVQLNRERVPHHADVFVEALFPPTAQAESEFIQFLQKTESKDLTFSIHYVVKEEAAVNKTDGAAAPALTSRLGENDVKESLRQICLFQRGSIGKFFSYLDCRSKNLSNFALADKCLVLSEPVQACIEDGEGENLLRQDARLVSELGVRPGVSILWENRYGPFGWDEVDWRKILAN